MNEKHVFALCIPNFWNEQLKLNSIVKIIEESIIHRLVKVLRIKIGQVFIFFDKNFHGSVEIVAISKKDINVKIINFEKNNKSFSEIIFLLPLLKKEALEEAIYSLTEIGVTKIQLVITQKSRQKLLHEKEFHRLESIVISAAEQSKNYSYPEISLPISFEKFIFDNESLKVLFDPDGQSFFDLKEKKILKNKIYLLVGPEGGLTLKELALLKEKSFIFCHLTQTILRAVQAVAVGAALFRI